ncbi:hypothetical protein [Noviherbaspirillum massiliense]|uniref:hypothetical protein n=1 Tax=Noviherbaspirillum massiliense TaxID=1465823 RepID=UPI0002D6075F|nr:hypothetical protein [Noviherbaspirillum massiliense]
MESILIACELLAIALLLNGYRRISKRREAEPDAWLFAYRTDKNQSHANAKRGEM